MQTAVSLRGDTICFTSASNWTNAQAAEFLASVLKAIEEDMDTLAKKGDE